jgi:hypothetical protein
MHEENGWRRAGVLGQRLDRRQRAGIVTNQGVSKDPMLTPIR